MKKILLTVLLAAFVIMLTHAASSLLRSESGLEKKVVHIAVAGPMGSENGQEMLRGASLYLNELKKQDRFKDTNIELIVFDDSDKQTAVKIANQIADENKVLLVIGHYGSSNSIAAGTIYKKKGIPAVTGSATSDGVTVENDWFFRVISGNRSIAQFAANYMQKALKIKSSSILYDSSTFGTSITDIFEPKSREMGIQINKKIEIDSGIETLDRDMRNVTGRLRAAKNLGMIFCATYTAEAAKFIASLRYPGTNYAVIGPDSLSTPAFMTYMNKYDRELETPGYYSDGIYAVSHFFADMAGQRGLDFEQKFIRKYGKKPSWIAACYYDAMNVACTAIERAEVTGKDIIQDRRRIKNSLARFNQPDIAVQGITGKIFFDKDGNVVKPLYMGVWHKQTLLPAMWQYRKSPGEKPDEKIKIDEKPDEKPDEKIILDGLKLESTRVVYTGIDINQIRNVDFKTGVFTADFYLWFRFKGKFDDARIIFTNAVKPIKLDDRFMTYRADGDTSIRSYRVVAKFIADLDAATFPFDKQVLSISLRHENLSETKLIYLPDTPGCPLADPWSVTPHTEQGMEKYVQSIENHLTKSTPGWNLTDISFQHEIKKYEKQAAAFSLFNARISVVRKNLTSVMVKTIFPFIIFIVLLYGIYMIPPEEILARSMIVLLSVIVIIIFNYICMQLLPAHRLIISSSHIMYLLAGVAALISGCTYVTHRTGFVRTTRFLTRTGKCLHGLFVTGVAVFVIHRYVDYKTILSAFSNTLTNCSDLLATWISGWI